MMQDIAAIAPVLGVFDRTLPSGPRLDAGRAPRPFGNRPAARYAHLMTGGALDWSQSQRGNVIVLEPAGRVDETTAYAFRAHLIDAVQTGSDRVVLDLSRIEYMSSRGLRALTLAQRAAGESGTTIVLASPNETMSEILAISRYDMVFQVADTVEDAVGS
ncbi:STAS domain-containing protein [Erythrobacter sp.]|uniref:STAS domain-containing protein n=1 Tax=Erythrobacter sp. TaxID=1042 RepID=UPI002EA27BE5|nr:STAS domain-containing protein [Erythrobacter sp.]